MEVYKVYLDWCRERENAECASRQVFNDVLDAENYAIFRPRKDLCDTCESSEACNTDEATYLTHRLRKEQAQNSKSEDKLLAAGSNGKIRMICLDLQAVLLAPALKASALYYRTKLCSTIILYMMSLRNMLSAMFGMRPKGDCRQMNLPHV
ncbi:hypothetical protein PoB_000554400 [Plakobranchus ocellatus]|uniref:DNA primase/nucleoside triphosphatase C-terminal domain-containing protein n=1 Tax=Plakobranchus ocellatus TaxID=259542 RepID=A0AAV3Y9U5_9GAST|nr:hypothetical protein PoB_000554400 [Plakobranchus ocellatus]